MSDFRLVKQIDPVAIVTGGLVPKGAYNSGTTYAQGDSVSYNNSSYVAIGATTGNAPTDTAYWQLVAAGINGSPDKNYTQSFSAVSSVVVTHNLGKYPSTFITDSAGDECEGEVVHDSTNRLTVTFSSGFSGMIVCN